jgi:two-component system chemotaxis sensor kinase CheA
MLDPLVEPLLQEIATEMAFLIPGQKQGLNAVRLGLEQLGQNQACEASADAQQELSEAIRLCEKAQEHEHGVQPEHLASLQATYERLSNALYLAAPLAVAADTAAAQPLTDAHDQVHEETGFVIQPGDDMELLNEFCNEGRDLLSHIEQGVLVLEENPLHKETLNQVFRAFHTFKGGAGFLGIEPIKALAHQLESLLDAARREQLLIQRPVIELILAGGDALQQYVDAMAGQLAGRDRGERIVVPTSLLLLRVQACLNGLDASEWPTSGEAAASPTGSEQHMPSPAPSQTGQEAIPALPATDAAPAPVSPPTSEPTPAPTAPKPVPGAPSRAREPALASFVKLDTHKLDALVDLMGELVIAQSMVVQHPLVQTQKDRDLERHLRQLSRITTDLQHNAMSLRMVPIRSAFQKMTRLVRDLATAQNKQVQLHLSGEDTELDRNIVEQLADPLLHMMRNAVDHGIETPQARMAQGKSAQGNIHLHAAQQGGGILIRMRDDGKGLDAQRIWDKAKQRKLLADDVMPTEKDIYQLIFLPGFSTADQVTDISGRGVGMDVVRRSISQLRGRVDIDSVAGEGTTFDIFLPLTLAIIDGMLVGLGNERFILPTLTIRESLKPQAGMVFTVQGKGEVVQVRDKLIPLVRLADKLGVPSNALDPCDGILVVVDSGARTRALLVDRLIGKQEVVIKSLGETFKHHKGMSGAAIMGDGRVTLIIDPDAIAQLPCTHVQASLSH